MNNEARTLNGATASEPTAPVHQTVERHGVLIIGHGCLQRCEHPYWLVPLPFPARGQVPICASCTHEPAASPCDTSHHGSGGYHVHKMHLRHRPICQRDENIQPQNVSRGGGSGMGSSVCDRRRAIVKNMSHKDRSVWLLP